MTVINNRLRPSSLVIRLRKEATMSVPTFSWVRALEEGILTDMQLETLQAVVDNGDADTLIEAARLLDYEATHTAGEEPGPVAY
jgi:hypothetical protein